MSHSEGIKLVHIKSKGPKPQIEGWKPKVEIQNEDSTIHSRIKEPVLAKYVRRHHAPDQIIGDKLDGTTTRRKLKGTCLLAKFEPKNVKDALENESWIEAMNEEIEKIEKNKT